MLLPLIDPGPCFLLNAASYLSVVAVLTIGPAGRPVSVARGGLWGGTTYLRTAAHSCALLLLVALVGLLGRSYPQVVPALVDDWWHGDARAYGTLAALPGAGTAVAAVLVALVLGRRDGPGPRSRSGALLGVAVATLGLAPGLVPAGVILVLVGLLATGTMTLLNAGSQVTVPDDVRGVCWASTRCWWPGCRPWAGDSLGG